MQDEFPPPAHLSPRAAALWRDVVPRRAKSSGRRAVVTAALEALDTADEARAAVAQSGLTTVTKSTGAVHIHPAAKIEREARHQFVTLWSNLGFDRETNQGDR